MASFQKIQELLLPCLEEEIIDDEEFSVFTRRMLHKIFHFSTRYTYADVVHSKGAVLDNCFGFIDGTVRPISPSMSN